MLGQAGGIEPFFEQIFGFLRRKTDFFGNVQFAEKIIAGAGKRHIDIYQKE